MRYGAARAAFLLAPEARAKTFAPLLNDRYRVIRHQAAMALAGEAEVFLTKEQALSFKSAIKDIERAAGVNGDLPEWAYNVGNLLATRGDLSRASQAYERALAREPSFFPARVNLAEIKRMSGGEASAAALLRQGIAVSPNAAALHHALGLSLVRQGMQDAAGNELRRAVELAPDNARYAYVYAVALASGGHLQRAMAALKSGLRRNPHDPDMLLTLGDYAAQAMDAATARTALQKLIADWPQDPRAAQARTILARL